jgi:hypothetical protein
MKIFILFNVWIFCLLILLTGCKDESSEIQISENQKQEMRETAGDFMKQLKSVLIKEIQTEGIVSAVSVCSDTAQILANDFGLERGVYIKRVSFKNRNEVNYPDEYEAAILKEFESMKQRGELDENSENIQMVEEDGYNYIKYMKPIFVQAECLNCHGETNNIIEPVMQKITEKYPSDRAVGYNVGDLRGAVSISKLIE